MKKIFIILLIVIIIGGGFLWINQNPNKVTVISIKEKLGMIPIIQPEQNGRYTITKTGVFLTWGYSLKADLYSFEILTGEYAKDKNVIFYQWKKITEAENNMFVVISWSYAKDSKHVFYGEYVLSWVDTTSFEIMDPDYSKDKNHVYYKQEILSWADPKTIELVTPWERRDPEMTYWPCDYQDKNYEFVAWKIWLIKNPELVMKWEWISYSAKELEITFKYPWKLKITPNSNPVIMWPFDNKEISITWLLEWWQVSLIKGPYQKSQWIWDQSITKEARDIHILKWTCPREWICKKRVVGNATILYGLWIFPWFEWASFFWEYIHVFLPNKQIFIEDDTNFKWVISGLINDYNKFIEKEQKNMRENCSSDYLPWECSKEYWTFYNNVDNFLKKKIQDNWDSIQKAMKYIEAIVNSVEIK